MNAARQAVVATAKRFQTATTFIPQRSLLIAQGVSPPSDQLQIYFASLASAAQAAGESLACASILAGHSSEADDFSDVSVFLGPGTYGKGHEMAVLKKLGLDSLAKEGRISPVELSAQKIPTTVEGTSPELDDFAAKLAELQDVHCFSVEPASGSEVVYSLVGKNSGGWGGLVGIGIWS